MTILSALFGGFGRSEKVAPRQMRMVRAGYDIAKTTDDNRKHWADADSLSANAALNPWVRKIIRERSRHEIANNSYACGISRTNARDLIGTGPRLQLTAEGHDTKPVERSFRKWAREVKLARKLRCMRMALDSDGESFLQFFTNPMLDHPVKLDCVVIEADRVTTPGFLGGNQVDGIVFDKYGNPVEYHVLREHPGDGSPDGKVDPVPAKYMCHWYRFERAGQARGVSAIAASLPIWSQLRRLTLAGLAAAETAADFAGILYTEMPAGSEAQAAEPFDLVELEKRALVTMPGGWRMEQMEAKQPGPNYKEFKGELVDEAARIDGTPSNVARGNSSNYNYASGRLDHQNWDKGQKVDRDECEGEVTDRAYVLWMEEASLIPDVLPAGFPSHRDCTHEWFWDGREHVDPAKEAEAQAKRLANLTTTLAEEYAKRGLDWEEQVLQIAREQKFLRKNKVRIPALQMSGVQNGDGDEFDDEDEDPEDFS